MNKPKPAKFTGEEIDTYETALANGFNDEQAKKLAKMPPAEFVKMINDLPKNGRVWIAKEIK